VIFVIWANIAKVEEVTRGDGRVVPSSREQVIQSLEGGILGELLVKEGDLVEEGQVLLRIDPTRATAVFREGLLKSLSLKATAARLRAEANGTALRFPPDVLGQPNIVRDETEVFTTRKRTFEEGVTALKANLELFEKEIQMSEALSARGLLSEVEMLRMKRQANDLRSQISERINRFRSDANTELSKVESELGQIKESVVAREDVLTRTTVISPVKGTVKNIRVTTIGGVIQNGAEIMQVVPSEDQLLIEARIRPADVAFLRPGLPVTVKLTAYDYAVYGGLEGKVETISPSTVQDDAKGPVPGKESAFYRIMVRTDSSVLRVKEREFPIIPGMTAQVDIRTGSKTVMSYLMKPIFRAKEAFRER
jgi:adhesin transport system membrane fusion protein